MNSVPRRIIISAGAVLAVLLSLNLWLWPNQALQNSATSFGIKRDGYKAAFDLLSELHFPVARSFRHPRLAPVGQTFWFVAPSFLDHEKTSAYADADEVMEWAKRGGTAVIFGAPDANWKVIGLNRESADSQAKDHAKDPDKEPDQERDQAQDEEHRSLIRGDLFAIPRWLDTPGLLHFTAASAKDSAAPAHARVLLTADGKPFALEIPTGQQGGRIIAIADANFLRNEHLAEGDASLVLVDLVHAFGAPVFDEHWHGLAPPSSLIYAILDSRAILPIIMGTLLAMLWIFSQRHWPRRSLEEDSGLPAPSIASFVESLSILYARAGDPAAVFRAYRGGFLRRLRRQIGLRADYPEDLLLGRIARDRSLSAATRQWLVENDAPSDQRQLVMAVRAIESYGHEDRA